MGNLLIDCLQNNLITVIKMICLVLHDFGSLFVPKQKMPVNVWMFSFGPSYQFYACSKCSLSSYSHFDQTPGLEKKQLLWHAKGKRKYWIEGDECDKDRQQ